MATWHNNFCRIFVHANYALSDFEYFQRRHVNIWHNLNICDLQLIKRLDAGARNQDKVIRPDFVKVAFLANVFREFAV
jgi:hypothetical protein